MDSLARANASSRHPCGTRASRASTLDDRAKIQVLPRRSVEEDGAEAHVTVGVAKVSDLETFEAEQLPPLTFAAGGISIYQLGNNGTAARHLKSWSAT